MNVSKIYIKLNAFSDLMIRLGDGLRLVLLAYKELEKCETTIDENLLYEILTDYNTYTNKHSINHFSNYITEYLINGYPPSLDQSRLKYEPLSYYKCIDEIITASQSIPFELFNFFHFELWDEIVKTAIINITEEINKESTNHIIIPFSRYCIFYDRYVSSNVLTDEDICTKFLSDLDSFLSFNHILRLKDFDINDTFDLNIKIKFNFSKLK